MSAERAFAWAAATAVLAAVVGRNRLPALSPSVVAVGLGAIAALPVAYVLAGWLAPLVSARSR
jgi:hypothetical protein